MQVKYMVVRVKEWKNGWQGYSCLRVKDNIWLFVTKSSNKEYLLVKPISIGILVGMGKEFNMSSSLKGMLDYGWSFSCHKDKVVYEVIREVTVDE